MNNQKNYKNVENYKIVTEIIALIPARSGSKRIPDKNIKLLGGKPLMAWSIETAKRLGLETWVTTDSEQYADIANEYGAFVMMRPPDLATDEANDLQVIEHALSVVHADMVVYLRPTTPFRESQVVWNAIRFMLLNQQYTLLRSVHEMSESLVKCVIELDGKLRYFKRWVDKPNGQCPKSFHPNGYVDICRGGWYYKNVYWYETQPIDELDTPEQWEDLEWRTLHDKTTH